MQGSPAYSLWSDPLPAVERDQVGGVAEARAVTPGGALGQAGGLTVGPPGDAGHGGRGGREQENTCDNGGGHYITQLLIMAFHEPWNSNEWNSVRLEVTQSYAKENISLNALENISVNTHENISVNTHENI